MGIAKKIARSIVFPAITGLGLETFYSRFIGNNCLISMHHGVVPAGTPKYNGRHFSVDDFEKHLIYFKRNFQIVSLQQIFDFNKDGHKPAVKTIALTFDDGYVNNINFALPLLEKYRIPATFFVQGMSMEDDNAVTWPDVINILRHSFKGKLKYDEHEFEPILSEDFLDKDKNISLIAYVKSLTYSHRKDFLQFLEEQYKVSHLIQKVDPQVWKLIGKDQLRELAGNPLIEIGSHSYSHYCLGSIDSDSARIELSKSKALLETFSQKEVISLAYPDGSYSQEVKDISTEVGYKNLCAVNYRLEGDLDDKRILPRHGLSTTTTVDSNYIYLNKSFADRGF